LLINHPNQAIETFKNTTVSDIFRRTNNGVSLSESHEAWMKTRKIFTMNTLRNCAAITAVKLTLGTATQAANIVEIASDNDRFKTQVAAVSAAGLVETLQGPGPLTVCTPLNDAFAALPAGTVETLLKPEKKAILQTSFCTMQMIEI
jgi:uncharacterized surface protein with fasciclin (FAS1) repeats